MSNFKNIRDLANLMDSLEEDTDDIAPEAFFAYEPCNKCNGLPSVYILGAEGYKSCEKCFGSGYIRKVLH